MAGHMNDGESHGTREEDLSGELRGEEGRIQGAPSRRMHPGCAVKKGVLKIDEHCEINWNLWNGAFSILDIEVHERNLAVLKEFIESHTRTGIERLKSETFEFAVEHANYLVHMGRGGVPKELILPGQFCSVFAGKDRGYFCWEDHPDFIENELRPHFEQVVRVLPKSNKLSMVFAEPDVCSFVKYVNNRAADRHYYMLSCSVLAFELSDEVSQESTQSSESDSD